MGELSGVGDGGVWGWMDLKPGEVGGMLNGRGAGGGTEGRGGEHGQEERAHKQVTGTCAQG